MSTGLVTLGLTVPLRGPGLSDQQPTCSRRPSCLAMASLEDKLACAICLQLYQAPVTLPCGHNFCCACIQQWEPQNPHCPTCRTSFRGHSELRRNVEFSEVVDMVRAQLDRRPGELPDPDPVPDPGLELATQPAPRCPRHGYPLELFCRTEGRCVCCACTVRECHGHQRALLRTARQDREVKPTQESREGQEPARKGFGEVCVCVCWGGPLVRSGSQCARMERRGGQISWGMLGSLEGHWVKMELHWAVVRSWGGTGRRTVHSPHPPTPISLCCRKATQGHSFTLLGELVALASWPPGYSRPELLALGDNVGGG